MFITDVVEVLRRCKLATSPDSDHVLITAQKVLHERMSIPLRCHAWQESVPWNPVCTLTVYWDVVDSEKERKTSWLN